MRLDFNPSYILFPYEFSIGSYLVTLSWFPVLWPWIWYWNLAWIKTVFDVWLDFSISSVSFIALSIFGRIISCYLNYFLSLLKFSIEPYLVPLSWFPVIWHLIWSRSWTWIKTIFDVRLDFNLSYILSIYGFSIGSYLVPLSSFPVFWPWVWSRSWTWIKTAFDVRLDFYLSYFLSPYEFSFGSYLVPLSWFPVL